MSGQPVTKGKRAAIYIRKSQVYEGVRYISPEMQREACVRWCEAEGYRYEVFADVEGHSSGGNDKRPGYQELRRRLKAFNTVVIHSLSRLSRNKRDYFAFLEDVRKQNIEFVCITQKIDTTTPYGRASWRWPSSGRNSNANSTPSELFSGLRRSRRGASILAPSHSATCGQTVTSDSRPIDLKPS
jgi:site-specific DNA recombinase